MEAKKVPDELREAFDEIHTSQLALQIKAEVFQSSITKEARDIAVLTKATWDETKAVMGLRGDWKYENGMVYPLTLSEMAIPNV